MRSCNSAFHPSGVGKWVPATAGKAKAGMVYSVSGWMRDVQVKLRSMRKLRNMLLYLLICCLVQHVPTRAIPERLRGVITTRRSTNPRLPLPLPSCGSSFQIVYRPTFNSSIVFGCFEHLQWRCPSPSLHPHLVTNIPPLFRVTNTLAGRPRSSWPMKVYFSVCGCTFGTSRSGSCYRGHWVKVKVTGTKSMPVYPVRGWSTFD